MTERHNASAGNFIKPSTREKITKSLAGVTLAAEVLFGLGASQGPIEQKPEKQIELEAAGKVAERFICDLESVVDLDHAPGPGIAVHDRKSRTTLKLAVDLKDNSDAQSAIKKYQENDAVTWYPPVVTAAVGDAHSVPGLGEEGPTMRTDDYVQQVAFSQQNEPHFLNVELYPRNDYQDGQQARVFMKQEVRTSDEDSSYLTTGYIDCGRLLFNGHTHTWEMGVEVPRENPVVTVSQHPWQR